MFNSVEIKKHDVQSKNKNLSVNLRANKKEKLVNKFNEMKYQ